MKFLKGVIISAISALSLNAQAAFIDFNDYVVSGFSNQQVSGSPTVSSDGSELSLDGNLWVYINGAFEITSDTVLYLTVEASGSEAEWYGFGFDNDNLVTASTLLQLGGPTSSRVTDLDVYQYGDGVVDLAINVGSYITGTFSQFVFVLDADSMSGTSLSFTDVELCSSGDLCLSTSSVPSSPTAVSAPAAGSLLLLSLVLLVSRRKI
jgi:hypothetical protein|tara:strand:+ start:4426 stop:5049 length:624 start_codon:yes stop_codon:yes gene_type:complete